MSAARGARARTARAVSLGVWMRADRALRLSGARMHAGRALRARGGSPQRAGRVEEAVNYGFA